MIIKVFPVPELSFLYNSLNIITVHKSSELTLSKVVLNLDQKKHCLGLSHTGKDVPGGRYLSILLILTVLLL